MQATIECAPDLPPLRRCYGHAVSQTLRSVAGGPAVATPRPSTRQKRYSAREVARRHSAPPAREGRGNTAGGQTTSGSVQDASEKHETLRFWTTFMLVDMPAYLAIRVGVRTSDFKL